MGRGVYLDPECGRKVFKFFPVIPYLSVIVDTILWDNTNQSQHFLKCRQVCWGFTKFCSFMKSIYLWESLILNTSGVAVVVGYISLFYLIIHLIDLASFSGCKRGYGFLPLIGGDSFCLKDLYCCFFCFFTLPPASRPRYSYSLFITSVPTQATKGWLPVAENAWFSDPR